MKKSLLKKIGEDNGNNLIIRLDNIRLHCFRLYSLFYVTIVAFVRCIKIDRNCKFYGVPHFRRTLFSSIIIGSNCTFRSDHTSNLIGVNHRCILSTHGPGAKIQIGDNCGFSGTSIGSVKEIIIGNNVMIGANSIITDFDWHQERYYAHPKKVVIQNNVWIGVNVTILKGVTIGENSIIGANSLVIKDIPDNVIAGGNPCRILKKLE